ncbi:MAG: hypothetical protein ABEJ56_02990 [Candidatus Nanohaloarchaea archaeon]
MGLFDKDTTEKGEVRISASEDESRLKSDVEERISEEKSSGSRSSPEITLEDIHSQNKRIIALLKDIKGDSNSGRSSSRSSGSSSSHRVTDRSEKDDSKNAGGGMDELL